LGIPASALLYYHSFKKREEEIS